MVTERMYELAFGFKKTKLWRQVYDSELFAVRLSDGEIGYCSILGRTGDRNAVALYVGDKGFQSLRTMLSIANDNSGAENNPSLFLTRDCIQCAYVTKDEMSLYDVEDVRSYAREHGIHSAGANAFPQFVRYMPYRYPWDLATDQERQRICEALEAGIYLAELLKTSGKRHIHLVRFGPETEVLPMLEKGADGFVLKSTPVPPVIPDTHASPKLSNDLVAARLHKMQKKGTLQCELTRLFTPAQVNEDEAPYFPVILLAMDEKTKIILPPTPIAYFEERPEQVVDAFADLLVENESCPEVIKVGNEQTFALLKSLCDTAEINLVLVDPDSLELLHAAKENIMRDVERDELDEDVWEDDDPEEMFEMILTLSDSELQQIPKVMIKQLLARYDDPSTPPEVIARLQSLLDL